jgi:hypothetical protein
MRRTSATAPPDVPGRNGSMGDTFERDDETDLTRT